MKFIGLGMLEVRYSLDTREKAVRRPSETVLSEEPQTTLYLERSELIKQHTMLVNRWILSELEFKSEAKLVMLTLLAP